MLVLEPSKRYSISQIKRHRWMQVDIPPSIPTVIPATNTQPNEQILRLMQSLGIDSSKTREVSVLQNSIFDTFISGNNHPLYVVWVSKTSACCFGFGRCTIALIPFLSISTFQSVRTGSYDHHAAIYYLLLDKLRNQLVGDSQPGVREVQRRRPSNIAEQAMRKIGRASTTEDCRRLLHSSTTPTASNSKLSGR